MACTLHQGPFVTINQAYEAISKWLAANGYRIVGPCREVYLREAQHVNQTDSTTVSVESERPGHRHRDPVPGRKGVTLP